VRFNIFDSFLDIKEATNIIILTHNIDFVFLQAMILPLLRKCGYPTLTIFADAKCAIESFQRQGPLLDGIGKRYRVVPVAMNPGFRFHSKAIMISSLTRATLAVGSGNLGFGGWKENGEIWIRFDTGIDGAGPFAAFRNHLSDILEIVKLNEAVSLEILEAFDSENRPWALDLNNPTAIFSKCGKGPSLFDQLVRELGNDGYEDLTICAPYFDSEGQMIREISKQSKAKATHLLLQSGKSNLPSKTAKSLPSDIKISPVEYLGGKDDVHKFLHAKFYAFHNGDEIVVAAGSANCSNAAWSIPGADGNAELVAVTRMDSSEYGNNILGELSFSDKDLQLLDDPILDDNGDDTNKYIRILAARYINKELKIGFECSDEIKISKCLIDDRIHSFKRDSEDQISINLDKPPDRVLLQGSLGGEIITSPVGWVDHELILRANSKQRSLATEISIKVTHEEWNIAAATDILDLLYKNLSYMPKKGYLLPDWRSGGGKEENGPTTFSEDDIFSSGYSLPKNISISFPSVHDSRISGLRNILLKWFGASIHLENNPEPPPEPDSGDDDDDDGDKEEKIPPRKRQRKASDSERRKMLSIINKISDKLLSPNFLEERPTKQLNTDICIISILLQSALSEEWLERSEFHKLTHKIWSELFFASESIPNSNGVKGGWLQYLYEVSEDKDIFCHEFSSVDLSVAFLSWAFSLDDVIRCPEDAFFELSCAFSVSRLPWLWNIHQKDAVAEKLKEHLLHTGLLQSGDQKRWVKICDRWGALIQKGISLKKFEDVASHLDLTKMIPQINKDQLEKGDLVWVGPSGVCVLAKGCSRKKNDKVDVLSLQSKGNYKRFFSKYLIPLDEILTGDAFIPHELLGGHERRIILDFMRQIRNNLQRTISAGIA